MLLYRPDEHSPTDGAGSWDLHLVFQAGPDAWFVLLVQPPYAHLMTDEIPTVETAMKIKQELDNKTITALTYKYLIHK